MDWYPHHILDYDADTIHLSPFEDGCYSRLLRWYYLNERPLPNDDAALAMICRIALDQWLEVAPRIKSLFVTRDKRVSHETAPDKSASILFHKRCNEVLTSHHRRRRDWKNRQDKLRKNNGFHDDDEASRVTHALVTPPEERIGNIERTSKDVPKKATRFTLTELPQLWRDTCLAKRPDLNPEATFEAFRDWWIAVPGTKGTKLDWLATWRTWLRNQKSGKPPEQQRSGNVWG